MNDICQFRESGTDHLNGKTYRSTQPQVARRFAAGGIAPLPDTPRFTDLLERLEIAEQKQKQS